MIDAGRRAAHPALPGRVRRRDRRAVEPGPSDAYGLTPSWPRGRWLTAALVAAKLRMAAASTLLAWLLVLARHPDGAHDVRQLAVVDRTGPRDRPEFFGAPRAVVVGLLALLALLATTWKQLVQGLAIGLTGREGLIKSSVLVRLSWLVLIGSIVHLLGEAGRRGSPCSTPRPGSRPSWSSSRCPPRPGSPAARSAAGCSRIARSSTGAASWLVVVLALYGVLVWLFDTPLVAHDFLMLSRPGRSPGAAVRGSAGPGVEPASGTRSARANASRLGAALAAAFVLVAVPWRWPWSRRLLLRRGTGTTAASCPRARSASTCSTCRRATTAPGPRRSSSACTARALWGASEGHEPMERGGGRARLHRRISVRRRRPRAPGVARGPARSRRPRETSASSRS